MITATQYQRPNFVPDWSKTPQPPSTMIGVSDGGELVINSLDLSVGLGVQHRVLVALTKKHQAHVERFGRVLFEKASQATKGGNQEITLVYFNENQALLMGSMSKNTVQVIAFKVTLVEEFDKARKALAVKECESGNMEMRIAALTEVVSQLSLDNKSLTKKLDAIDRKTEKYVEAKVVAKTVEFNEKVKTDKQKQREDLFSLFDRYMKVHSYRTGDDILGLVLDAMKRHFNVDLTIQKRDVGEHYFDLAIRFNMGYSIEQCFRSHLPKSGDLK